MKKKIFNTGVLGLTMIVLLLSVSACKSKQKVAQEEAAAAYNLKTGRPVSPAIKLSQSPIISIAAPYQYSSTY